MAHSFYRRFPVFWQRLKAALRLLAGRKYYIDGAPSYEEQITEDDVYYGHRLILGRLPDLEIWQHYQSLVGRTKVQDLATILLTSDAFKSQEIFFKLVGDYRAEEPVLVDLKRYQQLVMRSDETVGRQLYDVGIWEPHVTAAIERELKPGMVFIDIGANIGYYALLAAHAVGATGRVLAFEPIQRNCALLYLSAAINSFSHIDIYPLGVADQPATLAFDLRNGSNGGIGIESAVAGRPTDLTDPQQWTQFLHRTLLRTMPLDALSLNLNRLDVVKIDIEGAEYLALQGMKNLLHQHKPIIFLEFIPVALRSVSGVSGEECLRTLASWGYRLAVIDHDGGLIDCRHDPMHVMNIFAERTAMLLDLVAYPQ